MSVCLIYHRRMAGLQVLDLETAALVESVCDAIVPGSARVRPAVYIDALIAQMDEGGRAAVLESFATVANGELASHAGTPAFLHVRALAIEAFYSDFVAPGVDATGAWEEIDFNSPLATRLAKDWSYLGISMTERFDVVVVGSGAGGGVIAGELAERGRKVLLLETGPHKTAADFTRWEAKATHDLWWPIRFALIDGGAGGAVALLAGRCVGGTTTINTKVALRAHAQDYAKWHEASSLVGASGAPFGAADLDPHYDRVEQRLGVRERTDWRKSVLHRRACVSRAGRAARAGPVVHRRQLHELRLLPPGLPDECRQVHAQHLHPRRVGGGQARAARRGARRAGADRGRRGDGRRVRRPTTEQRGGSMRARSSSRPGR